MVKDDLPQSLFNLFNVPKIFVLILPVNYDNSIAILGKIPSKAIGKLIVVSSQNWQTHYDWRLVVAGNVVEINQYVMVVRQGIVVRHQLEPPDGVVTRCFSLKPVFRLLKFRNLEIFAAKLFIGEIQLDRFWQRLGPWIFGIKRQMNAAD